MATWPADRCYQERKIMKLTSGSANPLRRRKSPLIAEMLSILLLMLTAATIAGKESGPSPEPASPTALPNTLYIQPLGSKLSDKATAEVKTALLEFYGLPMKVLARKPLPPFAYYKPRRRWRAEKLLDYLGRTAPADTFRILGLTGSDISTTKGRFKDWGIMGLATLDGKTCVISMFRCRRKARNQSHARHRLAKTAVHEIGHTLGLEHCPNRGCLMEDAKGSNKTTDREYVLCPRCRRLLQARGFRLPSNPRPPWPRPKIK